MRLHYLRMKTLSFLVWLSAFLPTLATASSRPNVLFIAVDDLRAELGCYGAADMRTPNLDKLAARGMLFERAYCQVSVCNPSRSSVLSGARPDTTKVVDNQTFMRPSLPDVVALPQLFKDNGYQSVSIGKIYHHSAREPGNDPLSWTEDAWWPSGSEWFTKESKDYVAALKKKESAKAKETGKASSKLMRGPPYEASNARDEQFSDGKTALKAKEVLGRLKGEGKPFFLAVGFVKPHLPFNCPQKYWDLYPESEIKLPDNWKAPTNVPAPALHDPYELRSYGMTPPEGEPITEEMTRKLIRGYKACTSYMDAQLGLVLDELDRLGLAENTIVVVWGDHGYHLGEHGLYTKMTNFELGTRVPLIMRAPALAKEASGKRTRALVELVDLYPTLAELSGLPLPTHLEGTSFVPVLKDPARIWKTAAFSQYERRGSAKLMGKGPLKFVGRSIRTSGWRYTEWKDPEGKPMGAELYDEEKDPVENVNLADEPEYVTRREGLAGMLEAGWKAALPER